jgi:hypothetical protein
VRRRGSNTAMVIVVGQTIALGRIRAHQVTEEVYQDQICPDLQDGGTGMDSLFGARLRTDNMRPSADDEFRVEQKPLVSGRLCLVVGMDETDLDGRGMPVVDTAVAHHATSRPSLMSRRFPLTRPVEASPPCRS